MRLLRAFLTSADCEMLSFWRGKVVYEPGRQGTGYEKSSMFRIAETYDLRCRCLAALGMREREDVAYDCYLLRYPTGSCIPSHLDDAPFAREHHRINCIVQPSLSGGALIVNTKLYHPLHVGDAYVFRPDLELHEVTTVTEGERYIFTVGTLL